VLTVEAGRSVFDETDFTKLLAPAYLLFAPIGW